jgi:hypothetical protein
MGTGTAPLPPFELRILTRIYRFRISKEPFASAEIRSLYRIQRRANGEHRCARLTSHPLGASPNCLRGGQCSLASVTRVWRCE